MYLYKFNNHRSMLITILTGWYFLVRFSFYFCFFVICVWCCVSVSLIIKFLFYLSHLFCYIFISVYSAFVGAVVFCFCCCCWWWWCCCRCAVLDIDVDLPSCYCHGTQNCAHALDTCWWSLVSSFNQPELNLFSFYARQPHARSHNYFIIFLSIFFVFFSASFVHSPSLSSLSLCFRLLMFHFVLFFIYSYIYI